MKPITADKLAINAIYSKLRYTVVILKVLIKGNPPFNGGFSYDEEAGFWIQIQRISVKTS